jgi:hypothetical protein
VAALVAATVVATPAATGVAVGGKIGSLSGPRGLDIGPGGVMVVAKANGAFGTVARSGADRGMFTKLGRVPKGFLAPALDMNSKREVYVLTVGGPRDAAGAGTLYKWTKADGRKRIASIQDYQRTDKDPYDLEKKPRESNPYGVAALEGGGALVADAAGNDLLKVADDGTVTTLAMVKPRVVRVPRGLGEDAPPAGSRIPSESVITSVTVGPDGYYYIGELRGFPATRGTSQVWRVAPDADHAVCDPERPQRGKCTRHTGGLTSVVGLEFGAGGALYALELAKRSWLKAELSEDPAAAVGALVRISRDKSVRRQLGGSKLAFPGDVALDRRGRVFVTTPIFGPGTVRRVR